VMFASDSVTSGSAARNFVRVMVESCCRSEVFNLMQK
jgi:hypothetical protein